MFVHCFLSPVIAKRRKAAGQSAARIPTAAMQLRNNNENKNVQLPRLSGHRILNHSSSLRKVPKNLYVTPSRRAEHNSGGTTQHAQNDRSAFWEKPLRRAACCLRICTAERALSAGAFLPKGYKTPIPRNTHVIYTTSSSRLQALFVSIAQNFSHFFLSV